jgi:hypothetical protein
MPDQPVLQLNYPDAANRDYLKFIYSVIVSERLRQHHNIAGQKYKDGEITASQWDNYLFNYFEPRLYAVTEEINKWHETYKNSGYYIVSLSDLDTIFTQV